MEKISNPKSVEGILLFLGAFFLLLAIPAVLIYGFDFQHQLIRKAEKIIPYPAAMINGFNWISLDDFHENADSVRRFYENQDFSKLGMRVDFTTPDGEKRLQVKQKQVLEKMIEDEAVIILAKKEGISVSDQDLEQNVDQKLKELGNEAAVKDQLARLYGWSIQDFKERVVQPALFKEGLENVFDKKYQDTKEARSKIENAQKSISGKEKTFSEVVAEFSEGSSAQAGGELGWFKKDQIVPEIANQVFDLEKGEQSAILESPLGFHIVELEEKKKEDNVEMVRIRQIFAAKKTFADWLGEEMEKMKISIPLRQYFWNNEKVQVDFQSQELREFEQQLLSDPKGDASVIF